MVEKLIRTSDVMVANPKTVSPTTTIWAALALMRQNDIRHLLVVGADGKLEGILSNRDFRRLVDFLDADGKVPRVREMTVSEIMTKGPKIFSARVGTPLLNIAQLMVRERVGAIPIVDDARRPLGIVTQKDVMGELVRQLAPAPLNLDKPADRPRKR
ncbi:MAG: hypothetical protein A3E31_10505 [Candidatus Rokubacteria bacterium RIFCSPHIGHO2_12_FULL_73_22]|nr:MAG: hypothetical protein A3E31_10505 [Candidatus Rokubacteria bacterium RIFCSPHIGHO2_12_FULL_73_22]